MSFNESLYNLISSLCENLSKPTNTDSKRIRRIFFETLLKKPIEKISIHICDPIKELNIRSFKLKLSSRNYFEYKKCDEFDECIERISKDDYFKNDEGRAMLLFMLTLNHPVFEQNHSKLFNFGFTNDMAISRAFTPLSRENNPYIQQNLTTSPFFHVQESQENKSINDDKNPQGFFTLNLNSCINTSSDKSMLRIIDQYEIKTFGPDKSVEEIPETSGYIWEQLGSNTFPTEKKFASQVGNFLHLRSLLPNADDQPNIKIVNFDTFLRDLKLVTVGIQSESFEYINDIFRIVPNLTTESISPEILKGFVSELIECGTCYRRLRILVEKNPYTFKLLHEGFIFKSLCSSIDKFLILFKEVVRSYQDTSIMKFKIRVLNGYNQIVRLSKLLSVHPTCHNNNQLPVGSEILVFLYHEIIEITNDETLMLYISMLRDCCHVYFKQLDKWLFYGHLEDPCQELFIYHVNSYRPDTKTFFDRAYLIKKPLVPKFLQGFEDDILLCGKYTMLLKSFKPSHPLFKVKPPELSVCLTLEAIKDLENSCNDYYKRASTVCGERITVEKIFVEKNNAKKLFYEVVQKKFKENLENWKIEKQHKIKRDTIQKQKYLEELKHQIDENKENKLIDRLAKIEEENFYLQQAKEMEDRQIEREKMEARKRIKIYEELNKITAEQELAADAKVHKFNDELMKMSQTSETFVTPEESVFKLKIEDPKREDNSPLLTKSVSDYFNSNVPCDEQLVNKPIVGSFNPSTYDVNKNFCDSEKNRLKVLQEEYNVIDCNKNIEKNINTPFKITNDTLTDLQRNKLRVLGHEYAIVLGPDIALYKNDERTEFSNNRRRNIGSAIINSNVEEVRKPSNESKEPLSARVINRNRNLASAIIEKSFNNITVEKQSDHYEMSDLQKNRMKIMSQEFNHFDEPSPPNQFKPKLNLDFDRIRNKRKVLECEFNILTGSPTSTESDITPMKDYDNYENDVEMENAPDKLKLNTDLHETKRFGIPDTATLNIETPESALNTAGLLSKTGFLFPESEKDLAINKNIVTEFPKIEVATIKTHNFFALPMETDEDDFSSTIDLKLSSTRPMNGVKLTKYLQLSLTIPLNTHLKIINNEILKVYLEDLKLLDHFRSLRNYFFLMDGEFGSNICDGLISRLENGVQPKNLLSFPMLHIILEKALNSSIYGSDKNAERLSFTVSEITEKFDFESPDVLSVLSLSYQVTWPLNLILNAETLKQYSNIFRYLIKIRRIGWLLEDIFKYLKTSVKDHNRTMLYSPQYSEIQIFRHKLSHFIMTLQNHITSNALQAAWKTFKDQLVKCKTMEDLYKKHIAYIKKIIFLCMLNEKSTEYYKAIDRILKIIIRFCHLLSSAKWQKNAEGTAFVHPKYAKIKKLDSSFENCIRYTIHLGNKIVRYGYQIEIGDFVNSININGYYDKKNQSIVIENDSEGG